jgi:asparagine synthase (glutamine-hydrolysing)
MCGIAGVVGVTDSAAAVWNVKTMVSALARRGPDGEGIRCWDTAVLGHRRLAIFDLSEAGSQPMVSSDGSVGVVFNGAIYNYRLLRDELVSHGYSFISQTDTEVLVHGYRHWGVDGLVQRLLGMFAFGLWDDNTQRLYLVRDRLGVKPLVYSTRGRTLAFASSVRAVRHSGYRADLDVESVYAFLEDGFLDDSQSIYSEMKKVPAASIVEWGAGQIYTRSYWAPPIDDVASKISFADAVAETKKLFLDAVRVRLQADVTVGALLSGGIDSSLVCWAVQAVGGDIQTYTVGTPGDPWDEAAAARETAKQLGVRHRVIEMSDDDAPEIGELVSAYAEPFGSASALGMLRVCRAISSSSSVKVLLTGDGGDDAFLGYKRHRNFWIASQLSRCLPVNVLRWPSPFGLRLPRVAPMRRAMTLRDYMTSGLDGFIKTSKMANHLGVRDLVGSRLMKPVNDTARWCRRSGATVLRDFLKYELNTRFVGEYMTKVDGATMYYGIEARSPFLDQRIWEFACSIPYHIRLRRGRLKAILRELVKREIGSAIARRPKRGFGVPVQRWVTRRWRPWVEELLDRPLLEKEGWIREGALLRHFGDAVSRGSAPVHLWYAIVLEAWLRHEDSICAGAAGREIEPRVSV